MYFFFRFLAIPLAMIGWLLYQAIVKRRPWSELGNDLLVVLVFCGVWAFLAYLAID